MQSFSPTVVLRHQKENLKKCSLRGLEKLEGFQFYTYPKTPLPRLPGYILLAVDAPPLTIEDAGRGLLLLDGTWNYAEKMLQFVESNQTFERRSIPGGWETAYPRVPNPEGGLASIEAIYAAYVSLGRDTAGILDRYYWKEQFLELNKERLGDL